MILKPVSYLLLAIYLQCFLAQGFAESRSETGPTPALVETQELEQHRSPFVYLSERMIGSASRPVRFDWRKTSLGLGLSASDLAELNNFHSSAASFFLRFFSTTGYFSLGLSKVFTRSTASSEMVARTPYRQHGRPSRYEFNLGYALPVAEGIVTAKYGFFPAAEMVVSLSPELRYLYYYDGLKGSSIGSFLKALFSAQLTGAEQEKLKETKPAGMEVDPARLGILVGASTDLYFASGMFVGPKVLLAVPLLSQFTNTKLRYWWELTVGVGYAF